MTAYPYQLMFQVYTWTTDSKTTPVFSTSIPVTRLFQASSHEELMAPFTYSITIPLTDKRADGVAKGQYIEVWRGKTMTLGGYPPTGQTLWGSGYIQNVTKTETRDNEIIVNFSDFSIHLASVIVGDDLFMSSPDYGGLLDFLNGIGDHLSPGKRGILSGTGVVATWVDPALSTPPGNLDRPYASNTSVWANVIELCSIYGCYVRPVKGGTRFNGTLEFGPLGDASGLHVWGATSLMNDLNSSHGLNLTVPNAGFAQQYGYATISQAQQVEDFSHIINMVWGNGHGGGVESLTLRTLWNGPPDSAAAAAQGAVTWFPFGVTLDKFYRIPAGVTKDGQTLDLIAVKSHNDGGWQYGVCDFTSFGKWGPNEGYIKRPNIRDVEWLESAMIGAAVVNADPVPTWTIEVMHPLTSASAVPDVPKPGQTITPHYVLTDGAMDIDTNPASATWGQYISIGDHTPLQFPTLGQTIDGVLYDAARLYKQQRIVSVDESYEDEQYLQTLTLGKGKWRPKHEFDHLARAFHHGVHPRSPRSFHKHEFQGTEWFFSNTPSVQEITQNWLLKFWAAGALMVSDTPNASFFDDHHGVEFTVTLNADTVMDFWFAKPVDSKVKDPNPGVTYGVFRMAATGSSLHSGFYSTSDGSTFTHHGFQSAGSILDGNARLPAGTYRVQVGWKGSWYHAELFFDLQGDGILTHETVAHWHDVKTGGVQVIQAWGSVGLHYFSGTGEVDVSGLHASPHRHKERSRGTHNPRNKTSLHWKDTIFHVYSFTAGHASIQIDGLNSGNGSLTDEAGNTIQNEDGTNIVFASTSLTGAPGQYLVYNSTQATVTDGSFTVASKTFGALNTVYPTKPSWDGVYVVGQITTALDGLGHPWITGHHHGPHKATNVHVKDLAMRGNHMNWVNGLIGGSTNVLGSFTVALATPGDYSVAGVQVSTIDLGAATSANNILFGQVQLSCAYTSGTGVAATTQTSGWGQPIYPLLTPGTAITPGNVPTAVVLWTDNTAVAGVIVNSIGISQQARPTDSHAQAVIVWQPLTNLSAGGAAPVIVTLFGQVLGLSAT